MDTNYHKPTEFPEKYVLQNLTKKNRSYHLKINNSFDFSYSKMRKYGNKETIKI